MSERTYETSSSTDDTEEEEEVYEEEGELETTNDRLQRNNNRHNIAGISRSNNTQIYSSDKTDVNGVSASQCNRNHVCTFCLMMTKTNSAQIPSSSIKRK